MAAITQDPALVNPADSAFSPQKIGAESSLSNWVGPYVTEMLGKGRALGNEAYQSYGGPLTAGASDLQSQAFSGIGGLNIPTSSMGAFAPSQFTADNAASYMNPYLTAALQPQIDEARRQSEIDRVANSSRLTQSGAFGGSRQAIMDSENQRNLQQNIAGITGQGYSDAYNNAMNQFNTEQKLGLDSQGEANKYGLASLQKLYDMGAQQRDIESQGIAADKAQFDEEFKFPYKQVQYMQSLLQGLPTGTQSYQYSQPSTLNSITKSAGEGMNFVDLFKNII